MAWTTPRTWTIGELVTAALMNLHVRDNLDYVYSSGASVTLRGFKAYLGGAQAIAASTWTKLNLNTESWDTNSEFDAATNYRFTVGSGGAGKWRFCGGIYFSGGQRGSGQLRKNGSATPIAVHHTEQQSSLDAAIPFPGTVVDLIVGDYIELWAYQERGGGANAEAGERYTFFCGMKV